MTEIAKTSPRFNPERAGLQRVRMDKRSAEGRSSGGGGLGWLFPLLLVGGGLAGAWWAHDTGRIEIPGLNEVLAKTNLLGGGSAGGERLLSAGAEPHAALRYTWAEGLATASTITVEARTIRTLDGQPQPAAGQPALKAQVNATAGSSPTEGQRFWNFELGQLALVPATGSAEAPDPALQAELDGLKDTFKGTLLVDARGEVVNGELTFGQASAGLAPLLDQLLLALELSLPRLPEESVGAGASWTDALAFAGARLEATHELTAVTPGALTIDSTLTPDADAAWAPALAVAEGEGQLSAVTGTGTLARELDLAGLVTRLDCETTVEATLTPSAAAEGEPAQPLALQTAYRITLTAN